MVPWVPIAAVAGGLLLVHHFASTPPAAPATVAMPAGLPEPLVFPAPGSQLYSPVLPYPTITSTIATCTLNGVQWFAEADGSWQGRPACSAGQACSQAIQGLPAGANPCTGSVGTVAA